MARSPVVQARRAVADARAVCGTASPSAAVRWVTSLVTHLPECARAGSLTPADQAWARSGASFRTPTGAIVALPAKYCAGAREMYCRNVYLRTGLVMPTEGWVVDLGANRGLFSVWAAVSGAQVVAVEAQQGFAPLIAGLARHNGVADRVHVEIAVASGVTVPGAAVGDLADDGLWSATSHGGGARPAGLSVPQLSTRYRIGRIGLLKVDIEGGEFAVLDQGDDVDWLAQVDQIVVEVHREYGDVPTLARCLLAAGFAIEFRDNDGRPVPATSQRVDYLYGTRP